MPQPHDDRLALPVEQGVLLWCVRAWVAGIQDEVAAPCRIVRVLERLGAAGAAPCFDGFMFALSHGATRRIGIACVCQPKVGPDERLLLDAFGLAQASRPFEALLLLRGLTTPQAARAALHSAERLGAELSRAGLVLPAPEAEVSRFALALAPARPALH